VILSSVFRDRLEIVLVLRPKYVKVAHFYFSVVCEEFKGNLFVCL
jgi:hypothetical protein